jgi:hypothetical protein
MADILMASESLDLSIKGLYTSPSQFAAIPEGALSVANNVVIDRPNIVSTRRGQENYGTSAYHTGIDALTDFNAVMIRHLQDGTLQYDSDNLGTFVSYAGLYSRPDPTAAGSRVRFFQSNRNLYFLTDAGTMKLDHTAGIPRRAGAPRGQSGSGVTSGASGWMATNTAVAYRIVWGYRDANNNLILGAPSERIIVTNTSGGNRTVDLTFQIPDEIDESWFYQVYRSDPSASSTTEPSDDLRQQDEAPPTAGQLTAGLVTLTDRTPTNLLQGFLYTNTNQDGILQSNFRPPFAKDACTYRGYSFYANTRTAHTFDLNLLSVVAPDGLQVNDTITFTRLIDSVSFTLTAKAAENSASGYFLLSSTGDPGYDLQQTALSLVKILNVYSSNTFLNGYYTSGYQDVPGQMTFEMNTLSSTGFKINSSRSTCWTPTVSSTGAGASSSNELAPNRIYWSRELQPEAVPIGNWIEVGTKSQGIDRIIALRDGIIILKQDGVFRLSGQTPSWTLNGLDNTVRILAPNTAATLDNQVYFMSDQGVVAASDNAVQILSYPIERQLLELTAPSQYPNVVDLAFAVTYNADRKYILALPTSGTDTSCKQEFCYNTITNTWTRWTRTALCGFVFIRDNKLYFGGPTGLDGNGRVTQERKNYNKTDFADESWGFTITAAASNGLSFTADSTQYIQVGSTIRQGSNDSTVTAISGSTVFVQTAVSWSLASATTISPIDTEVRTVQIHGGKPNEQKHFTEASFIFSESNFSEVDAYFTTDLNGSAQKQILKPAKTGGWGQFAWGDAAWGGGTSEVGQSRIRTLIPNLSARANWLYISMKTKQCFTSFGLSGLAVVFNKQSSRQRGGSDK